ncbi:MAG: helix-turn-helix transcriptional regulator [Arenicellales bacterium]
MQGILYNAERSFTSFMLAEWPDWEGPQLPAELVASLRGGGERHVGHRTAVSIETMGDMRLLTARATSVLDQLSQRENEVAALYAEGSDFRSIADSLPIAPATVRNHLRRIYAKLDVTSKIEMARLISEE